MIWSWYLADDTQFYVIGLIILLISTRYSIFASVTTGVLLVAAWSTTAVITLYTNHKPRYSTGHISSKLIEYTYTYPIYKGQQQNHFFYPKYQEKMSSQRQKL